MEHKYYAVHCETPNDIPPVGFINELGECPLLTEGNIILKHFGPYKKYYHRDILGCDAFWVDVPVTEVAPWISKCTQWKIDSIVPTIDRDGAYSHTVLLVSPADILG